MLSRWIRRPETVSEESIEGVIRACSQRLTLGRRRGLAGHDKFHGTLD
jgi:hypothetical protein